MSSPYGPPQQSPFAQPYASSTPNGQASPRPSPHIQFEGPPNPIPQHMLQQQRPSSSPRGSYNGPPSQQPSPYSPNHGESTLYFSPAPNQQLHPQEAYATDPFAHRRRTSSSASAMSHHSTASRRSNHSTRSHKSHHSDHSHHSHHSDYEKDRWSGRKPGDRATMGDTLMGMWNVVLNLIPAGKR